MKKVVLGLGVILGISLLAACTGSNGNDMKDVKDSDSYQTKIQKIVGKNTEFKEDNNVLIITLDKEVATANTFINIGFPQDTAKTLQFLKDEDFNGYIIRSKGKFLDNKGNESEKVTESVYFESMNIKDINFDNWINQVTADSTIFYDLSSAYYVDNSLFNKYDKKILKIPNKTLPNPIWNKYGRELN